MEEDGNFLIDSVPININKRTEILYQDQKGNIISKERAIKLLKEEEERNIQRQKTQKQETYEKNRLLNDLASQWGDEYDSLNSKRCYYGDKCKFRNCKFSHPESSPKALGKDVSSIPSQPKDTPSNSSFRRDTIQPKSVPQNEWHRPLPKRKPKVTKSSPNNTAKQPDRAADNKALPNKIQHSANQTSGDSTSQASRVDSIQILTAVFSSILGGLLKH